MGCDIHAHFEIKLNGKWEHFSQPQLDRNYKLFSVMAGVRDDCVTNDWGLICAPKGLPDDLSIVTKFCADYWGDDGHTHSWFNAKEIDKVIKLHEEMCEVSFLVYKQWGYLLGNGWESFGKYSEDYPEEIEDIRLVFWFDC